MRGRLHYNSIRLWGIYLERCLLLMITIGHCFHILQVSRSYDFWACVSISLCIGLFIFDFRDLFFVLYLILRNFLPSIALHHYTNSWHLLALYLISYIIFLSIEALNWLIHYLLLVNLIRFLMMKLWSVFCWYNICKVAGNSFLSLFHLKYIWIILDILFQSLWYWRICSRRY